jgi:hypothetical protein
MGFSGCNTVMVSEAWLSQKNVWREKTIFQAKIEDVTLTSHAV